MRRPKVARTLSPSLWGGAAAGDGVVEILPDVRDQLAIGGMIGRFDANDAGLQRRVALLHIAQEVQLGHRGPEQQGRTSLSCT